MAFSKVSTGLTNKNDLIDEIITFATAHGWTLEQNFNPTSGDLTPGDQGVTGRNTWLSMVPSSADYIAHRGIQSPDPDRMYVGFRPVSASGSTGEGVQIHVSGLEYVQGFGDSPRNMFWGENRTIGFPTLGAAAPWGGAENQAAPPPIVEIAQGGPYTSITFFSPTDTSPLGQTPNYIYFVIEFTPGRFVHGGFGQMQKFTPWAGGWGSLASGRRTNNAVDNINNSTMWNEVGRSGSWPWWIAADIKQRPNVTSLSPLGRVRWFGKQNIPTASSGGGIGAIYPISLAGHAFYRDLINPVPGAAPLSGFTQLITPWMELGLVGPGDIPDDTDLTFMPACYPLDFFMGDITNFDPGIEVTIGGEPMVPFPITSKLGGSPSSSYGGYFYRKRV